MAEAAGPPPGRPVSLVGEVAALRTGRPGLAEHVDRLCHRIDRRGPVLHAFVSEPGRRDRLHAEARALEAAFPAAGGARPALFGAAVGVTDVVRVDGLPTHAGSALPPGVLAGRQAGLVGRLRAAGALVAGKTATAEFGLTALGPTGDPHDPGGSGGGSAVAAGLVPLAVAVRSVGSVIRTAACCGVVGFRPTYGRIPLDGVIVTAPSLDTAGVFTADAVSAALAASVLCDDWRPPAAGSVRPVLGVPVGPYLDRVRPQAAAAFEARLALLEEAGLTVRRVALVPDPQEVARHLRTLVRFEAAQVHADWFARFGGLYRHETAAVLRHGRETDPDDYLAALRARSQLRELIAGVTLRAGVDLWLTPAGAGPASSAPDGTEDADDTETSLPWAYAGLPAVSLPTGRQADGGLSSGLQCVAAAGADERLLGWALALEGAPVAG